MDRLDIGKLKGPIFTVWMQANPPKVLVQDEFQVPQRFFSTPVPKPMLQKNRVIEAWKKGEDIPGVQVVQEKSLRVK
ncbi:hypothetical protein D3C73_1618510 [compost metagenome]